jgi:hypothetical protein
LSTNVLDCIAMGLYLIKKKSEGEEVVFIYTPLSFPSFLQHLRSPYSIPIHFYSFQSHSLTFQVLFTLLSPHLPLRIEIPLYPVPVQHINVASLVVAAGRLIGSLGICIYASLLPMLNNGAKKKARGIFLLSLLPRLLMTEYI